MRYQLAALVTVGLIVGCAESPSGPRIQFGPPAQLQIVSGNFQSDTVGRELPEALVVRVVDSAGHGVPEQIVNFRVTGGAGSVFGGAAITNDSGEARERWTLGTVAGDTQRVEARAVDTRTGAALVFGTFVAVGVPDIAATVAVAPASALDSAMFVSGDTLLTGDSLTFAAYARDRHGNAKPGAPVTWTTSNAAVAGIGVNGRLGAVGVGNTAVIAVVDTAHGSRGLSVQLRVPVSLALVLGADQSDTIEAMLTDSVRVRVTDRRGAPFTGATVVFRGVNGGPPDTTAGCSCKTATSNAAGLVSAQWRLGPAVGVSTLAIAGRLPSGSTFDSLSLSATVRHGAAASLSRVSGGASNTGLIVAVRDRRGNPASGVIVHWSITGPGSLSDTLSVSDIGGLAGTSVTAATGSVTVLASVQGLAGSPVSFTVTTTPNYALDFAQSYINVPDDSSLDLGNTWTLEAWINPRNVANGTQQDVISKWDGGGDASYSLQLESNGRLRSVTHDGVSNTVMVGRTTLSNASWQHIAVTFANGTVRLYVNGVLDTTIQGALSPMNSTQPLAFGREGNYPGFTFNGFIDEVRVWKVARTASELLEAKNVRLSGTEQGLVGYWRFDEGAGDVAFDATSRGNNGRLGTSVGTDAWDPQWSTNTAPIP